MERLMTTTAFRGSGDEFRKTVTGAESAPAVAADSVDCRGFRWAYVRVDALDTVTSGTLAIYLADGVTDVAVPYDTVALSATNSVDVPVNVGGVSRIAARVTALVGTSVRRSIRLSNDGPSS